jgi:gas vesicle protein
MSKTTDNLMSFLAGAAAGVILGILYAPDKGKNTRERLAYKLERYKQKLEDLLEELMEGQTEPILSNARSEGEKVIQDAREKAEKLLEDVDTLIGQIREKK